MLTLINFSAIVMEIFVSSIMEILILYYNFVILLASFLLTKIECAGLANGKLTRGLVQTESSLVQNADTVLSQFYATSPRDTTTRTTFLQNQLIVEMSI